MIPNKLDYTGPVVMLTYYVVNYHMIESELPPKSLKVTIQLKRMVSQHLLSTYLPSLCILIIAQVVFIYIFSCHILFRFQMTVYFRDEHFRTSIPVAITSMLVMYTLNQSVSSKLPPTSYVKLINIWILFGISQPFFIIIILVLVEHLPRDSVKSFSGREAKQSSHSLHSYVKFFGKVINPIWQILFIIIYSCIALSFYY